MAHIQTPLPTKHGELQLAKQLKSLPDNRLHLFFALNFIPGVKDVDLVIWHESAGIFVVEVKAVPLDAIEIFGWQRCKILNRDRDRGPQQQAHDGLHSLRNFLVPHTGKLFMTSVACFPQIRRSDWNRRWDDDRVIGPYADSMLFEDDLYSDPQALVERLEYIRLHPSVGEERQPYFRHDEKQLRKMAAALNVEAKPKPTISDIERLRIIEARVRNEEKKLVAPFSGSRFVYTGEPGTGKTFRLLKIAYQHAIENCKVLFACFNKVLAADMKRLLKFSEKLPLVGGELEVHDVWEMITLVLSKPEQAGGYDEWAALVVEQMKEERETLPKFDTILVDEAQDMKDWAFEMLLLHSHEKTTFCIAAGSGQELYGNAAQFLKDFSSVAKKRPLRRYFRNTETITKFALICFESDWSTSRINKVLRRFGDKATQSQFQFDRPGGQLPSLVAIDETALEDVPNDEYSDAQNELMVLEYRRIIKAELESLAGNQRPTDLLILVPNQQSNQRKWAAEALEAERMPFLDYTQDDNRRCIAPADQIRLCTFHSSRGIEGQRVLLFGIEKTRDVAQYAHADPRNLGYIVLSRAVLDVVVAYRPQIKSPVVTFLQAVIGQMRAKPGESA